MGIAPGVELNCSGACLVGVADWGLLSTFAPFMGLVAPIVAEVVGICAVWVAVANNEAAAAGAITVGNREAWLSGSPYFCKGSGNRKTYRSGSIPIKAGVAMIRPARKTTNISRNRYLRIRLTNYRLSHALKNSIKHARRTVANCSVDLILFLDMLFDLLTSSSSVGYCTKAGHMH